MATDTAANPAKTPRTAPDPARNFWQVPLFFLGVFVFVSTWQGWLPLGTPDPASAFERDVAALRVASERAIPAREELMDLLAKVAGGVDRFPDQAASAQFALGSGYLRLAEQTTVLDESRSYWTLALQHFGLVQVEGLPDSNDPPRLAFRAAKARAAVAQPPGTPDAELRLTITLLERAPPMEPLGDAERLRGELALRLTPPDLGLAVLAFTNYVHAAAVGTPPAALDRANLQLGELHFRRNEVELAQSRLEQIGRDPPPDVPARAKSLLAQVYMAQGRWPDAIREWESLRALTTLTAAQRASSSYHLGLCKLRIREPEAATKLFEEALKGQDAAETTAAAIRLADLYLKGTGTGKRALAADLLVRAVKVIMSPREFRTNPLIPLVDAQATFELALTTLEGEGAYEPALKVADAYKAVAEQGRSAEKHAEILAAWATALKKSGGEYKPRAVAAAEEFTAIADKQTATTAKVEMLSRAAAMYRLADDPGSAVTTLEAVTKLRDLPDAMAGKAWEELANALLAANRPEEVWTAFNKAMAANGAVSTAIRYRLGRHFADTRRPEFVNLARLLFEQIANQTNVTPAEVEYQERALIELAQEMVRNGNFLMAEPWLNKQLSLYPTGPEASLAKLLLGVCLLQRASMPPPSGPDPEKAVTIREDAKALFEGIVKEIDKKKNSGTRLNDRESWLRLQAGLRTLQTYLQMAQVAPKGNTNAADNLLAEGVHLRELYPNTVEELIIMSLMFHAFRYKNRTEMALDLRDQMRLLFNKLPPSAFPAKEGEYSRAYWEKWWFPPEQK
jgi:tetratricopeptide (TPR) repeat protein